MPNNYKRSVEQLLSLADFERKARADESPDFHLLRTRMLMERLGNPHESVPAIHVAGSKGKGSTCAMIAAGLVSNGLRTGMFISPHLHRMTERFTVNGAPITEDEFVSLFERIWPAAEEIRSRGDAGTVSVFEFQTAMAFLHFAEVEADVMVIEVGLGGRLDSTNIINPAVSVITPVGLDHVAVLGDTLEQIAGEKAGIIKPGIPVVVAEQQPEAEGVIVSTAKLNGSELIPAASVKLIEESPNGAGPQIATYQSAEAEYRIELPLLGEHQLANAATAIAALETFGSGFAPLDPDLIASGISNVQWPGRVQVLDQGPPALIVDGAHNHESAVALRAAVNRHFGELRKPVLVLGSTGGHDPLAVGRVFADLEPSVIVTRSRHPKAVEPSDFAAALKKVRIPVTAVTESTSEALAYARNKAGSERPIIATGSLFIAAEAIEAVSGIEPEMYPDLRGSAGPVRLSPGESVTSTPA